MNVGMLNASITLLTSGFSKGVSTVVSGLKSMGVSAIALNQSLALLDRFMNGIVGKFASLANSFLETASKFDMLRITLDTLTKGKGDEWFEKLNEWAIRMPINTEAAIKSFQQLIAMGLNPTTDQMTVLVDTVSALGGHKDTLDRIAKAIGQMQTTGYIHAQDVFQLAQVGVPVIEFMTKYTDLTKKQIANIGEYKIKSEDVINAIVYGMNERFGGQSAKVMEKFQGQIETLVSLWREFQRVVMASGPMAYIEAILKTIIDRIEKLRKSGEFQQFAEEVGQSVEKGLRWVVEMGQRLWDNRGTIINFFKDIKTGAEAIWPAVHMAGLALETFLGIALKIWKAFPEDVTGAAGVGILARVITGSNPIGVYTAALSLINTELEKLNKDKEEPVWGLSGIKYLFTHDLPLLGGMAVDAANDFTRKFNDALSFGPKVDVRSQFYQALADSADAAAQSVEGANTTIARSGRSFDDTLGEIEDFGKGLDNLSLSTGDSKKDFINYAASVLGGTEPLVKSWDEIASGSTEAANGLTEIRSKIDALTTEFVAGAIPVEEYQKKLSALRAEETAWQKGHSNLDIPQPGEDGKFKTSSLLDGGQKGVERAQTLFASTLEQISKLRSEYAALTRGASEYDIKMLEINGDIEKQIIKHREQISLIPELGRALRELGEAQKQLYQAQIIKEWEDTYKKAFGDIESEIDILKGKIKNDYGELWEQIQRTLHEKHNLQLDVQLKFGSNLQSDVQALGQSFGKMFQNDVQGRIQYLMEMFMQKLDLSAEKAAGIVGSLLNEAPSLDPNTHEKGGSGFGIAQWTSSRLEALKKFAGDQIGDLRVQALFLIHELMTSESAALKAIRQSVDNAGSVAQLFTHTFERPGVPHRDDAGAANRALSTYRGGSSVWAPPATPTGAGAIPLQQQADIDHQTALRIEQAFLTTILSLEQQVRDTRLAATQAGMTEKDKLLSPMNEAQAKVLRDIEATREAVRSIGGASTETMAELDRLEAAAVANFDKIRQARIDEKVNTLNLKIDEAQFQNSLVGLSDIEKVIAETNHEMALWGSTTDEVAMKLQALGQVRIDNLLAQLKNSLSLSTAFKSALSSMEGAFTDFFMKIAETGKFSFRELGASLLKALQQVAAQMAARSLMHALEESVLALVATAAKDYEGASAHWKAAGIAAAAAPLYMGFVVGSGLAQGMAHKGIDNIPEDGTWLLKKKERVVDAKTNQDLKQFLKENQDNKPAVTMNVSINNSDEEGVLKALPQLKSMIEDVVNSNISGNGSIRHSIMNYT